MRCVRILQPTDPDRSCALLALDAADIYNALSYSTVQTFTQDTAYPYGSRALEPGPQNESGSGLASLNHTANFSGLVPGCIEVKIYFELFSCIFPGLQDLNTSAPRFQLLHFFFRRDFLGGFSAWDWPLGSAQILLNFRKF